MKPEICPHCDNLVTMKSLTFDDHFACYCPVCSRQVRTEYFQDIKFGRAHTGRMAK